MLTEGIVILEKPNAIQTFPSEHRRFTDEQTGAVIHQMTQAECINHPPYFLTPAFTPDDRTLIFTSYRTGSPQLFEVDFPEGDIRQLTDLQGYHPYSPILSKDGKTVYFTCGDRIQTLDRHDLSVTTLYHLNGAKFGECSLSADDNWVVTALKHEGQNGIVVAKTDGSGGSTILAFPRTIIHPQFHSLDSEWIEFAGDPAPRMFRIRRDGRDLECLYEHGNDEFVVHETFLGQTGNLAFTVWPFFLKEMNWQTKEIRTIAEINAWHITPNKTGSKILCDTNHPDRGLLLIDVASGDYETVCYPQSSNSGTQWKKSRYAVAEDWAAAQKDRESNLSWMEMPTDHIYGPQYTHPHPAFSASETMATFTSDRSGYPQVYVVELPA